MKKAMKGKSKEMMNPLYRYLHLMLLLLSFSLIIPTNDYRLVRR